MDSSPRPAIVRKPRRIRDPVHNLIEFGDDPFDQMLWAVIQTHEFQRLRRIRQLGFSEFVFPGATHTRFAHSIGVLHMARLLMQVIQRHQKTQYHPHRARVALAAALVHDVGHGMFSHAFEEIGRKLTLPMANHETVSERLIRDSAIARALGEFGGGFADDVANVIKGSKTGSLYDSVVSSQFDADRLDYMQRDRMMAGVESSRIDATWLLANLEIGSVRSGADDEAAELVETLVVGPKAFRVAESYVLSLFQLYPNVYFHKVTRAAERVFTDLFLHLMPLVRDGHGDKTGLPANHPIRRFAVDPGRLELAVALDDAVFWGAVPLLMEAEDALIADRARRLWHRNLPACIDIGVTLEQETSHGPGDDLKSRQARHARIQRRCQQIVAAIEARFRDRPVTAPPILVDQARRQPYKRDSRSMLNQILIRHGDRQFLDMADMSAVVASAETFEICRVYVARGDTEGKQVVWNIIRTTPEESSDVRL